jgi:XTP/dITP diphosphohydrolase
MSDDYGQEQAIRKLKPGKLVIASHNEGKVREIKALLAPFGIEPVSAGSLGLPEPEETGTTFVANAELKAMQAADLSGLPALADDSGIAIAALNGAPGVYSADWAGDARDFTLAINKVHDAMLELAPAGRDWAETNRAARFVSVIMLAWPDGHVEWVEGEAPGEIVWPPRGAGGHGYDPIFAPAEDTSRTYAEMGADEKNAISHRARAFRAMLEKCFT